MNAVARPPLLPRPPLLRLRALAGWLVLGASIIGLLLLLPESSLHRGQQHFIATVGIVGVWRYTLRMVHFTRAMLFLKVVYPRQRRLAESLAATEPPSHVYLLVTSFRIDPETSSLVYRAAIDEAVACGHPSTVVASIVELGDELLIRTLWQAAAPPPRVALKIVRIAGTGKRDGLAVGFRAISRDLPDERAVVAVVDGDTVLLPGVIGKCAAMLGAMPEVGALTTNEYCDVRGGHVVREWHRLRFAERHLNMCSMALNSRVMTLTGRMSMFRAHIATDAEFIRDVESDSLLHWRLGRIKFLTGDDKSSWYSVTRAGWKTHYVPDAAIVTVEHPPDPSFITTSFKLMRRWYGNTLRQNGRARALGPARLGWFTWYVLQDQRVQMWAGMLGLTAALLASLRYSFYYLLAFVAWIGITRCVMCLLLRAAGHRIGPLYPLLMYYNQVAGSCVKILVSAFPDRQSWTRQKTALRKDLDGFHGRFNDWSSRIMVASSVSVFLAVVVTVVWIKPRYG